MQAAVQKTPSRYPHICNDIVSRLYGNVSPVVPESVLYPPFASRLGDIWGPPTQLVSMPCARDANSSPAAVTLGRYDWFRERTPKTGLVSVLPRATRDLTHSLKLIVVPVEMDCSAPRFRQGDARHRRYLKLMIERFVGILESTDELFGFRRMLPCIHCCNRPNSSARTDAFKATILTKARHLAPTWAIEAYRLTPTNSLDVCLRKQTDQAGLCSRMGFPSDIDNHSGHLENDHGGRKHWP